MSVRVEEPVVRGWRSGSTERVAWEEARRRLCAKSVGSRSEPRGDWLDPLLVEEYDDVCLCAGLGKPDAVVERLWGSRGSWAAILWVLSV